MSDSYCKKCRSQDPLCEECKRLSSPPPYQGPMPRTVEHYQANAIRDQELILEQRDEIRRLKHKANQLQQKINQLEGYNP